MFCWAQFRPSKLRGLISRPADGALADFRGQPIQSFPPLIVPRRIFCAHTVLKETFADPASGCIPPLKLVVDWKC
eukprot:5628382-Pyramimonas_sp.AAC.1